MGDMLVYLIVGMYTRKDQWLPFDDFYGRSPVPRDAYIDCQKIYQVN